MVANRQSEWLVLLLVIPCLTWANEEANSEIRHWLDGISDASLRHSYEGTFIYRCSAQLVAMKIVHAANGQIEREKLVALSGPAHQVIQDGRSLSPTYAGSRQRPLPAGQTGVLSGPPLSFDEALDANYRLVLKGENRVAGRLTNVVEITPKDKYRYGFSLWLDKDTGLVLRSDMVDAAGQIIEQIMFTNIKLLEDEQAEILVDGGGDGGEEDAAGAVGAVEPVERANSNWQVANIPSGFLLTEHYFRSSDAEQPAHEHMVFTDGLASVSVFIERTVNKSRPFIGDSRMGAVNAFGNVVKGHQVTVVGDVPLETVKLIGQSVKFLR